MHCVLPAFVDVSFAGPASASARSGTVAFWTTMISEVSSRLSFTNFAIFRNARSSILLLPQGQRKTMETKR